MSLINLLNNNNIPQQVAQNANNIKILFDQILNAVGEWDNETEYKKNDLVIASDKNTYISTRENKGIDPVLQTENWLPFALVGESGVDGIDGVDGAQGEQGEQGAQGYQGYQGDQGAQGVPGPQGAPGEPGVSNFLYVGAFNYNNFYERGNIVSHDDKLYVAQEDVQFAVPGDSDLWLDLDLNLVGGADGAPGQNGLDGKRGNSFFSVNSNAHVADLVASGNLKIGDFLVAGNNFTVENASRVFLSIGDISRVDNLGENLFELVLNNNFGNIRGPGTSISGTFLRRTVQITNDLTTFYNNVRVAINNEDFKNARVSLNNSEFVLYWNTGSGTNFTNAEISPNINIILNLVQRFDHTFIFHSQLMGFANYTTTTNPVIIGVCAINIYLPHSGNPENWAITAIPLSGMLPTTQPLFFTYAQNEITLANNNLRVDRDTTILF